MGGQDGEMVRAVLKIAICVIICLWMRLKVSIYIGDSAIGGSWEVGRLHSAVFEILYIIDLSLLDFLLHGAALFPKYHLILIFKKHAGIVGNLSS